DAEGGAEREENRERRHQRVRRGDARPDEDRDEERAARAKAVDELAGDGREDEVGEREGGAEEAVGGLVDLEVLRDRRREDREGLPVEDAHGHRERGQDGEDPGAAARELHADAMISCHDLCMKGVLATALGAWAAGVDRAVLAAMQMRRGRADALGHDQRMAALLAIAARYGRPEGFFAPPPPIAPRLERAGDAGGPARLRRAGGEAERSPL